MMSRYWRNRNISLETLPIALFSIMITLLELEADLF